MAATTDEQLAELLDLTSHSDSVELKLTVPLEDQRKAIQALGLDPLEGQIRLIYFFDTPDLALEQAGVVVRARRVQGKGDDSVVKLRPVVPQELPDELRESASFFVEVDAMPGGFVCSGSMKGVPRKASVQEVFLGEQPLRKLLSKEQRAFYSAHAPEGIKLDDLVLLGPIFIVKLKGTPAGANRRVVVELWLYPDGSRILELSTKCAPGEGLQVAGEMRAFLAERGIPTTGDQQTKTRTALEHFAAHLDAEAS
ncbi:MAG: adenylate cyclase [Actinobacteria bacterium]|nr:MAG: adenylate cyclase [Actinomycetota bacterium]